MMLELVWPLKSGGGSEGQKEEEDLLEVQRSAQMSNFATLWTVSQQAPLSMGFSR